MPASVTESFIGQLEAMSFDSLPRAAIDVARQVILDGLACAFAGSDEPLGVGRIVTDYVRTLGEQPQASVINGGFRTSMPSAAFANGSMMNALDFDNSLQPPTHPTSPALPVILAIAEHEKRSGKQIVEALIAAIEAQARLRHASTGLSIGKGFHKPGIIGIFGSVTAAVRMLNLDRAQALMAFGIAGSRASGLAVNTGTMTKPSHAGNAARMGVESGLLARAGWTASADVFGPKGYFDSFMAGNANTGLLTQDFETSLRMLDPGVGFKAFPCNYFTHRPIEAALFLRDQFNLKPDQIESVEVIFPPFDYVNRPQPRDGLEGKFSVQYTVALALLDGEIRPDAFGNERLRAADIAALLPRIRFRADEAIPFDKIAMHVIVNISLKDGRQISRRVDRLLGWPGAAGNPLTRQQRHQKFFSCTRQALDAQQAKELLELVEDIESQPDASRLMELARNAAHEK